MRRIDDHDWIGLPGDAIDVGRHIHLVTGGRQLVLEGSAMTADQQYVGRVGRVSNGPLR
jgi:hypothetical protein